MKFILRSATMASVLALGVAGAQAADLTYEPAPVAVPEVFNWTGFYIGVHGGIGGGNIDSQFRYYDPEVPGDGYNFSDNAFGAFGGVQAGYNWQFNTNWVVGLETDFAASGIEAKHSVDYSDGYSESNETKVDWFGTIRGRLGYAWDNVLFYGTGGAAYGKVKVSGSYDGDGSGSYSDSDTNWGWTAGAGVEYGITKNVTLKAEYLYVDLGSVTADAGDDFGGSFKSDVAFHTLKAGLNYKF
ncbi:porin family protein [Kaistia defluvii]|uniref:outer membrane protein n=1 Tax=Kaistia defluvii TaxID=410841 RepID=UPI00224D00ED|nr:porin family protein [Kaistia defluvii]